MRYFLNHSFQETGYKFNLSDSELKSLFTAGYRDPKYNHLRKDFRRKDEWSQEELIFLLQHAGLQNREYIAKKLNRGGIHSVKEVINRLNSNTRYINGLPLRWAREILGNDKILGYKVKAGPKSAFHDFRPILVPWVLMSQYAKRNKKVPPHIVSVLGAMANFQKKIHGTKSNKETVKKICKIIGIKDDKSSGYSER